MPVQKFNTPKGVVPSGLTPAQAIRQEKGLPFMGAQPEMVFLNSVRRDSSGSLVNVPGFETYYVADGRHGDLPPEQMSALCIMKANILFRRTAIPLQASVWHIAALDRNGAHCGAAPCTRALYDRDDIKEMVRQIQQDPKLSGLSPITHPGLTLQEACQPYNPNPYAHVDFSAISRSVSHQFRGARTNPQFSRSHAQELRQAFPPPVSGG